MRWAKGALGIGLLLVAWEVVARAQLVPAERFPELTVVLAALADLAVSPGFLVELSTTWGRALLGLALGVALGLALALVTANFASVRRTLDPLIEMLRVLPPPALVPISIFIFGLGLKLFLFIIAFAAIWPVYINAANALAASEPVQLATGRAFGYSRSEILLRLRLPAAMPGIFTGIRIGGGLAVLATVAAEMLAGQSGAGFLLYDAAFTLRSADMFAIMLVIGATGVLMNLLIASLRRLTMGWHIRLTAMGERI